MDYIKQLQEHKRRRDKILAALAAGIKPSAVARKFKITHQRVSQIAKAAK